ncbi:MAG: ring-cleaving dioxygenase [Anaerolineae bacterium]
MTILGLHHITIGANDAQRTIDFYSGILGLRFIKRTVNFDDPGTYHLYFGDEKATPGSAVTFFEWPDAARGRTGIGGTHHFALTVADRGGLLKWKRRLNDFGVRVDGIFNRTYFESIYFRDPDGLMVEIATRGPGLAVDEPQNALGKRMITPNEAYTSTQRDGEAIAAETWPEPVPEVTADMRLDSGMHHISATSSNLERTAEFLEDLLGMKRVKMTTNYEDPNMPHWVWAGDTGDPQTLGAPGTLLTYFGADPSKVRRAQMGAGQTHHYALAVKDDEAQAMWRDRLLSRGVSVSPIADRLYFHSIYFRDPDGHIVEIATLNPGFTADEPLEELGSSLKLPPWYEAHRPEIARVLKPLVVPEWKSTKK